MDLDRFDSTQITLYNIFAGLGVVLNAAVLAPVLFSSTVKRRAVWIGLVSSFIVYSFSFLAILGRQTPLQPPPFGLCFLQAALIYASPLMCIIAYTCFTIDFSLQMFAMVVRERKGSLNWPKTTKLLIHLPWLCFLAFFLGIIGYVNEPSLVERTSGMFYCHLRVALPVPSVINIVTVIIVAAIIFPLQLYMVGIMYRHWGAFRRSNTDNSGMSLSICIRMFSFTLVGGLAFGLSAALVPSIGVNSVPRNLSVLLTIVPSVGALTFGTQTDILSAWAFCIKRKPKKSPDATRPLKLHA